MQVVQAIESETSTAGAATRRWRRWLWRCRCCSWPLTRAAGAGAALRRSAVQRVHGGRASSKPGARATGASASPTTGATSTRSRRTCRWRWSRRKTRTSPTHYGFDFKAIEKARKNNARGRKVRGAQHHQPADRRRTCSCGAGAAGCARASRPGTRVLIEALWPKRRIIEVYANVAEFGDGVYGAQAAARTLLPQGCRAACRRPKPRAWRRCCPTRAATASPARAPTCSGAARDPAADALHRRPGLLCRSTD